MYKALSKTLDAINASERQKKSDEAASNRATLSSALASQRADKKASADDARMRERVSLEGKNALENDTRDAENYLKRLKAKRKDDEVRRDEEIYPGGKPASGAETGNKQLDDLLRMDGAGATRKGPGIMSKIGSGLSGLFKRPAEAEAIEPQVPGLKKKAR